MTNGENIALRSAVDLIGQLVPNASGGLPDDVFYLISRMTPLINVDLLIVNDQNEKLLTWREDRFYGPGWHIPGGIIRFKETAHQRIVQTAKLELGVEVEFERTPVLVDELINADRETRGHFISMIYRCRLVSDLNLENRASSLSKAEAGQWIWVKEIPANMIKQQLRFKRLFSNDGVKNDDAN